MGRRVRPGRRSDGLLEACGYNGCKYDHCVGRKHVEVFDTRSGSGIATIYKVRCMQCGHIWESKAPACRYYHQQYLDKPKGVCGSQFHSCSESECVDLTCYQMPGHLGRHGHEGVCLWTDEEAKVSTHA